jgi:hypothetical protein
MPINTNIAMGYRGVEIPQQNVLADYAAIQQIQGGQRQAEVSQMQIDAMRRDEATLKQIQAKSMEHGGPTDLDSIADAYLKSGNAKFVEFGIGLRQKLDEKKQFASIMGSASKAAAPASEAYPGYNESIGMAAPAPAAAPASEPYPGYNQAIGMTPSVNAMAPAAAPAANALADVAMLRQRRDAFLSMGTPQAIAAARALDSDIALASKAPVYHSVPGVGLVNPITKEVLVPSKAAPAAPPVSIAEFERAKTDPAFMKFLQDRAAATRAPVQPVAPTITTVEDPNNPGKFLQVDARQYKGGGANAPGVIGAARPSATAEKTTIQRTQMGKDLGFAITQLSDITKDGGLIDQSTGSGAGRLVDLAARFGGKALPGDIAIGKIAPIADLVLKMVPRFEGPQSNADTKSYKEAAGQLADSSLPTEIRKAAGRTVLRLMQERKDQFVTSDMAAEGTPAAAGAGVDTNNPLLK